MGLDMYILRKPNTDDECEVVYWRKANAIHSWMIRNTNYSDNMPMANITRENIEKLKHDCENILRECEVVICDREVCGFGNVEYAQTNMPIMDGFFFDSSNYNNWYFYNINLTIEYCEKILENYSEWLDNGELIYYAWY